ncbi:MAG: type II toxin-antitoxin system VapB family antitoxin [Armatimonadetes bacterium]|nr:type II toxin-antitoxin system VapB family antitoxin [Armatimonadota bacterium]
MRTTVDIPDELMDRAMELSPARTKREVLTAALEEYVKELLREEFLSKRGTGFLDMTHEDLERMRADD